MINTLIYQILFISFAAADIADFVYGVTPSAVGCGIPWALKVKRNLGYGFDLRVFQYDLGNMDMGYEADFMASGYTSEASQFSAGAITDINFAGSVPDDDASVPYEDTLFGEVFDVSNFVAEFTSYFYPSQSGFYKLESDNTDDSMMLFIGGESALQCCTVASTSDFSVFSASSYNIFTANNNASTQSSYQYLRAGYYYPIRIVYVNMASNYAMQFKITYPDGTAITEFDNGDFISPIYFSEFWYASSCYSTAVSDALDTVSTSWTGSTTSYSTYYPTGDDDGLTGYFYYPDPTTTVTAHYYGSTISSDTATPTGAGTWIESIFYPEETVTSYVPWTGATTETSTTFIPDDPEVPATVVIEIPDAITTTTIQWTGTETSSSTIYPENGQNGTITVEIFTPRDIATSTVLWTGNFTSTYTTISPENVNGTVIVGVEIPRGTATVTDFWSGSSTSYTTEFPSDVNDEIIVHEYVPQKSVISGDIVYITTYWIGDFTSYSTTNPGYSNGTTTVFVDIPQQVITETWTGVFTSTTFYCPYGGAASTPVVLVPSSTTAPESPEICKSCKSSSTSSNGSSRSFSSDSTESAESSSSLPQSNNSSVSSFNGPSESSLAEYSESSISTQDAVIDYSNNGNRLLSLNLGFIISLLSTFYIII